MATLPRMSESDVSEVPPGPGLAAETGESRQQAIRAELSAAVAAFRSKGDTIRLRTALHSIQQLCQEDAEADRPAPAGETPSLGAFVPLSQVIQDHVVLVYQAAGCNKTRAARILDIDIKTLYNKLKRYGQA
ncbi:MAG: helix-turn-helix domain-containing protein [Phycisphaerae bacterium]